ncbi:hypothetical protein IWW39_002636 [Coemansia spiralis]|uniref:MPN domain-containing protein n=1 Tax=Coemansia spiralis TaxID=417178 RepID=A0A9W8L5D4_9FUNG|nr:hypothetical protein IWW39_002636 [Coemansia spiralis]
MTPRTSGTVVVHPLVLLNISEHTTRTAAQSKAGSLANAPLVCGALLGRQLENQAEVFLSFELKFNARDGAGAAPYELDDRHFLTRTDQMKQIFPEDEFIGWYVVASSTQVTPAIAALHQQIMRALPTALLLVFDTAFETSDGGASLPLAVYDTLPPTRVERAKLQLNFGADCGDSTAAVDYYVESTSDDAIPLEVDTVWASHLVPLRIAIDSGEAERVAIEHVANVARPTTMAIMQGEETAGGAGSSTKMAEGQESGQNAPVELTSRMATFLSSQRNAVDMLHRDITVLKAYVGEVISGAAPFDPQIMQLVHRVLCNRPVVQNDETFDLAMMQEETNFHMTAYLANITTTASVVRNLAQRSNAALSAARNKHQPYVNVNREGGMYDGGGISSMFGGGGGRQGRHRGFGHFR